jgi:hypothetical protein
MMKNQTEKKIRERQNCCVPIVVSIFNKKNSFYAQAINSSMDGICFKSNTFLRPGTTVYLRVKQFLPHTAGESAFEGLRSVTLGEIKWCKELVDADTCTYEVGVKYPGPAY